MPINIKGRLWIKLFMDADGFKLILTIRKEVFKMRKNILTAIMALLFFAVAMAAMAFT